MLVEPETDDAALALDQTLLEALRARLAAPARRRDAEALALRALLADAAGPELARTLRAVWGRMEAARRPVALCGPVARLMGADRHGGAATPVETPDRALQAAREGALALIDLDATPWWARLLAEQELRVVLTLPDGAGGRPKVLGVARDMTGPTGDDRSFLVADSAATDAALIETLSDLGFAADPLVAGGGLKLFMLAGYVQAHDARLGDPAAQSLGRLSGVIGQAPVF